MFAVGFAQICDPFLQNSFSGEFLNFILLGLQFFLTNKFLNDKFTWYGWRVIQYYSYSTKERMNKDLGLKLDE